MRLPKLQLSPSQDLTANPPAVPIGLEGRIAAVGASLARSLLGVLEAVPRSGHGPQSLATALGLDKVLASRVLKALRSGDPLTTLRLLPGPEPLRRVVRAAARKGAGAGDAAAAMAAVDAFENLIRTHFGDRSLLDAMLSAWVPEARREFELRRKQAAFKAMSQLRGVQADVLAATVLLSPAADGEHIDIVWLNQLQGLHRVRPGVRVKLSSRRLSKGPTARHPSSLTGEEITGSTSPLVESFCSVPRPRLEVRQVGETVFYLLGEDEYGGDSAVDLVFAEVNRAELNRYVPTGSGRKAYFFAEVTTPAQVLQFDVLVHEDLYPGQDAVLRLYDASFEGVANPNDPARDIDQLDMMESVVQLGKGQRGFRSAELGRYSELVEHVLASTGFDGSRMRGYRCRIDYPLYGSQVVMMFDGVERAGA
jgi:hypothetical protein